MIGDNLKGTCMLIDVATSGERNVIMKIGEEILKYVNLAKEVEHMWDVKAKVIPVNNRGNWNHFKIIHTIP